MAEMVKIITNRNRLLWIAVTILYAAAISYFSAQPVTENESSGYSSELFYNLMHIPAYGLLAVLTSNCFGRLGRREVLISFAAVLMFGIINELIQLFVPSRSCSLIDVALNGSGALLFLAAYYRFRAVSQRRIP